MASATQDYLGKAVRYPIRLVNGSVEVATGNEVIKGSLIMILTTPLGTRQLIPDFGSRLDELLWEPNDEVLQTLLRTEVISAVSKWERRIRLADVAIISKDDLLLCRLIYTILASNETDSFVYPFYRKQLPY